MINENDDLLSVRTEGLGTGALETVQYLEACMEVSNEKGFLARLIHQLIAQGIVSAEEVATRLGAYEPDGIPLDDDNVVLDGDFDDETQVLPSADETTVSQESFDEPVDSDQQSDSKTS